MGLDMYISAESEVYISEYFHPDDLTVDNIPDLYKTLGIKQIPKEHQHDVTPFNARVSQRVGYWRKHPNLHGYIVENFADGEDTCQRIYLYEKQLQELYTAIVNNELEETTGFFFGRSPDPESEDPEERQWAQERKEEDLAIITSCLALDAEGYQIVYQASW